MKRWVNGGDRRTKEDAGDPKNHAFDRPQAPLLARRILWRHAQLGRTMRPCRYGGRGRASVEYVSEAVVLGQTFGAPVCCVEVGTCTATKCNYAYQSKNDNEQSQRGP